MATDKFLNLEGLEQVAEYVNKKLRVVTTIPANPEDKDIILYKGTTLENFIQGSIYMYEVGLDYYSWSDGTNTYYTLSETPEVGDAVYESAGDDPSGSFITAYDATNDEVTIDGTVYARNSAGDVNTSKWVLQDTSIILNGLKKTGDEANFYAPTMPGTEGQILVSKGLGRAPEWEQYTGYCPTIIDDTVYFTYGTIPDVDNSTVIFDLNNGN